MMAFNQVRIESLDQEGRGIAHADGKVIFIEGALPGELVSYSSYRKKPNYEQALVGEIYEASVTRVTPACPHFGVCGGCSMQHMDARAQVAAKQRVLEDNLKHIGKVEAESILPPIYGEPWGYRHRARFSVRHVAKKGGVLVGFHEKRSSYVADMRSCRVVPQTISDLLEPLRELIAKLSIRDRMPQIELAIGGETRALVLRILEAPSAEDEALLKRFANERGIQWFYQTAGPETAKPFYPQNQTAGVLYYTLPEFDVQMGFLPTDFTQVNHAVNTVLVRRALALLQPQAGERIADLFCGLGNFTLAIARSGAHVLGVEGAKTLVERARKNAAHNGLAENAEFAVANLFEMPNERLPDWGAKWKKFDRMLIDPPRDGAMELVKAIDENNAPRRIVYVSCNPATLARDAAVLVHTKGYALKAAGIVNMFPHTSHVESIAVFDK